MINEEVIDQLRTAFEASKETGEEDKVELSTLIATIVEELHF